MNDLLTMKSVELVQLDLSVVLAIGQLWRRRDLLSNSAYLLVTSAVRMSITNGPDRTNNVAVNQAWGCKKKCVSYYWRRERISIG